MITALYGIILERNHMEKTKRVKSKIVYPHLGIIDEIEEEIFVRDDEEVEQHDENETLKKQKRVKIKNLYNIQKNKKNQKLY